MTGVELIAAERQRQIDNGFTPEHDLQHQAYELIEGARAYMKTAKGFSREAGLLAWPFETAAFKPGEGPDGDIRSLAKAGALIAAEIDRLQS